MTFDQSGARSFRMELASSLQAHWKLYLFEGIVLIILGIAAILIPQIATLTVELFIGWLLLFSGIAGLFTTFSIRPMPGFWWSLFSALIGIAAGLMLLFWPISGVISLTLVLIAFFILEGIASILFALEHRAELPGSWWAMLLSGIVDLVLAALIFLGLPSSAGWAIGLLVGINLIFGGCALSAMALQARNIDTRA
ncbi:HdeD family acid-resistance protein [Hyphomicrobium sp.]|uniref:HdeD family acid-resistance protein n=1 Tax=Hyphomicrobium sp. TaxID=82 RepID=UPI000FA27F70|nr:HdeD family acid-resistance protein [Hyphomicrobium sp.]MBN9247115.1 HdeD family acid-resistance protein [Hyphomicrobium sp.]RUP07691.1 MAG: HdeD family acid-resistance protein [Hyphomicrobium sp.]